MCICWLQQRLKLTGIGVGVITVLAETVLLIAYIYYHYIYWKRYETTPWVYPQFDIGTTLAVTVTFISLLTCNVLLVYGTIKFKIIYIIPWMVMHGALFLEAVLALIIFLIAPTHKEGMINLPSLVSSFVAIFILGTWIVVKNIAVLIYTNSSNYLPGSDSREQFLEMGSYVQNSPRLSCVTQNSLHPPINIGIRSASIC